MCVDLQLSNVLLQGPHANKDIAKLLYTDGPPVVEGMCEINNKQYPIIRSQPIPHKFFWNSSPHLTELLNITLTGFGQGAVSLSN